MKIVFFGTPDFAVATLNAIVENKFEVLAVVTAPDKQSGRGMKLQESAVKKYALEKNLAVLQPEKLKDALFIEALKNLNADVFIVVAFRMLPEIVWNMPPMGTINLHGSLLPQYRGAAPINWAIIRGEKTTGVTTFKLQHEIDTGNILMQEHIEILETDNAGSLHDKMMNIGAELMVKTLKNIEKNTITETKQILHESIKHAPKIFTETCKIVWDDNGKNIYNFIRGLSPYPAAFSYLNHKKIKIFETKIELESHEIPIGTVLSDNKTYLKYSCKDGFIHLLVLQLEGKTKMKVEDFLRGYKV